MNPYGRFNVVSNAVSAAIVLSLASFSALPLIEAYKSVALQSEWAPAAAGGAALAVTIVVWLALTEAVLPFFFRYTPVRRLILGKHYMEGTWIQAEKLGGAPRMAVIEIQPAGASFRFSGYAVDDKLDVLSNVALEFSKFDWPFMTYKFRNTLADTAEDGREGVGEIHFEANRHAPRSYNGFVQTVNKLGRVKIEGVRLTKGKEIRDLRSLERRADVIDRYWGLFFERGDRRSRLERRNGEATKVETRVAPVAVSQPAPAMSAPAPAAAAPVAPRKPAVESPRAPLEPAGDPNHIFVDAAERRDPGSTQDPEATVIPRRRATDWSHEESEADLPIAPGDEFDIDFQRAVANLKKSGEEA